MRQSITLSFLIGCAALLGARSANAQLVIQDNFNDASSTYGWTSFDGACLTAGDGTGTIPACIGLSYYHGQTQVGGVSGTLPDANGSGALRLTNGFTAGHNSGDSDSFNYGFKQAGGIISNFTFPSTEGLQVTFTAVSYRGNSGNGADGVSFFLLDGAYPAYDTGAFGGSLGYDCSNTNNDTARRADGSIRGYDGLPHAYLGVGIDEYGNFNNRGDNAATGATNGTQTPNEIGVRGAGNVSWAQLSATYPTYFPGTSTPSQQQGWVQDVCSTGQLLDYTSGHKATLTVRDYNTFASTFTTLPAGIKIASVSAQTRGAATPIAYKLKITSAGLLSLAYSYNGGAYLPVITGQSITAANGALPANFRFGFAGSTGGSENVHELMCFQASPSTQSSSGAGLNQQETAKVQTGTQVYFAYYNPNTWAGSLTSNSLVADSTTGAVSIATTANWDASCVLTGVASGSTCAATGVAGATSAQGSSSRVMLTFDGTNGIAFQYSSLSTAMKSAITNGDSSPNSSRVNYLRGDRSNELTSSGSGIYRARASVLGDIIDSSPAWVGPPSAPYLVAIPDMLSTGTAGSESSYLTFKSAKASRVNVVYVGADDGFLHGFRTGRYSSTGTYIADSTTPNDGQELIAYMPQAVVQTIHSTTPNLDYANANYGHNFFVDASPGTGDLYYNSAWHTWVVGGLGAGGAAIYILDVTDPTTFSEGGASPDATVIQELNPTTMGCTGCSTHLGNTYGTPQIRRFHNGQWGFIYGNGYGSSAGTAGIFVTLVNTTSGALTTRYYASGSTATGNGIAYTTPVDMDGDHITDYVYAGDLLGNVWRFDLTSNSPASWGVRSAAIFTTAGGQPITTKLIAASVPSSTGLPRLMIGFGTGQLTQLTNTTPTTFATAAQSLYGVWDSDMTNWNTKGSMLYATLSTVVSLTPADLLAQSITNTVAAPSGGVGLGYRTISSSPICWAGTSGCTGSGADYGWTMPLPGTNEQVVYSPILQYGAFIVNTTIPANNAPTNCQPTTATGWTMAVSMANGGAFPSSFFVNSNNQFLNYNGTPVNGIELDGTGTVSIVTATNPVAGGPATNTFLVTQTVSGAGAIAGVNTTAAGTGKRLTWAQKR